MVMVKDLTQLTVKDLWKEVKDEEDWWGDINERVLGMVKLIMEGSLEEELMLELQADIREAVQEEDIGMDHTQGVCIPRLV
jgi:hypothetical protein